ncbi:hypothetical protein AWJ20_2755 [Sugiyamaella lignohabitans]|uniref:SMP-30/Gluconolactonase/LRE-like region domain-containing protein n=1 Tax=Sugiyamaella lignohabitans TaxID=796027 RepID=A0A167FCW4_9ASCO|nr:uncharacterized protein AWJ20_2755 [Sugiyamaella lignohabitans]ANB15133.1 hypothetical protein AWJ20_2755 [Sugiyamaella lignohabitans]
MAPILPNVLYVDAVSNAVVDPRSINRGADPPAFTKLSLEKPFVSYSAEFTELLGQNPSLRVVAQEDSYPFAHEAGVWIPSRREVYFTSNQFQQHKNEGKQKQIRISRLLIDKEKDNGCYEWENMWTLPKILTPNGATNYKGGVLLCCQGQGDTPGSLVLMELESHRSQPLLNNFYGRPFNSPNDVVIYPLDGSVWFTDPNYGHVQGLRSVKMLPNQVYCFDPKNGSVRVVADGIHKPNGISFSFDNRTCYITDTQIYNGVGGTSHDAAATIYAFDIVKSPHSLITSAPYTLVNRRVFAYADCGAPDGIKCDTKGNVYAGCIDGIHVWNCDGVLIGKILIKGGVANFCFTDPGRMFLFNENKIYEANIAAVGALNTAL